MRFIALLLGFLTGGVFGILVDRFSSLTFFSNPLLAKPILIELYIIKFEMQLTVSSVLGFFLTLYYMIKKEF